MLNINRNEIVCSDVLECLRGLPDESINCVITSPPYKDLRDYQAEGQIGLESTWKEFYYKLALIFREVYRVLRKDGVCFINMGDSYASGVNGRSAADTKALGHDDRTFRDKPISTIGEGLKSKDLCGQPWRLAFALQGFQVVQTDKLADLVAAIQGRDMEYLDMWAALNQFVCELKGQHWYLRQDIIWHKPNPMPESVNDRCTKAHEYVFLLTKTADNLYWTHRDGRASDKQPKPDFRWINQDTGTETALEPDNWRDSDEWERVNLWKGHGYYFDSEAIRETTKEESHARAARGVGSEHKNTAPHVPGKNAHSMHAARVNGDAYPMPTKSNKRSVWTIPTEANKYAHFATFPKALIAPMILAGCPEKCCAICGKPWIREVIESDEYKQLKANRAGNDDYMSGGLLEGSRYASKTPGLSRDTIDLGLKPGCECNGETLPGIVLDIFMGSGTTALVARELGRDYIGCELNPDYVAIANERLREPFEPHYVQKPDKPLKRERVEFNGEVYEQTTLFDFLD